MAPIPHFAVEQWMNEYETTAKYNLAETCCNSVSLNELIEVRFRLPRPTPTDDSL